MRNVVEIFGMSFVATVLFMVAHFVMRPAPVPALIGLVGGLVAFWAVTGRRTRAMALGWSLGTIVGMAIHLYSHYSEGRMGEPTEGIALHMLFDAARGALVAIPILAVSVMAIRSWSGKTSTE